MITPSNENVRSALSYISPDLPRDEWVKVGMAIKNALNGSGLGVFDEWSKSGQSYSEADTKDTWKSIKPGGSVTIGTLFYEAMKNGWKPEETQLETVEQKTQRKKKQTASAKREAETKASKAATAARKAAILIKSGKSAENHPYLIRKDVKPVDALRALDVAKVAEILGYTPKSNDEALTGQILIAPVEVNSELSSAELIDEFGRKSAIAGGTKSAGYWAAKPLPETDSDFSLLIGEGVATVLSSVEATEYHGLAALTAGNLEKVAVAMRKRYPNAKITILADVGNGKDKAEKAACAANATLAVPDFNGMNATEKDTDFNDLHRISSLIAVREQILNAKTPEKTESKTIDFDEPIYNFPHITDSGRKRATIANLRYLFDNYGITVSYDELLKKQTIRFNNTHDRGHGDLIDNAGVAHIRSLMALNGMPASSLDLLPALFAEKSSNPILTWIESKKWDGKDRLKTLADTLTVADEDKHYRDIALRTWLIQCVAAADGARRTTNKDALAKYELAFILQGNQGVKKTSWFKKLVPKQLSAYIIDGAHLDPADKETVRTCISSWICELGELDSTFRRSDISRLKAFLSKQTDTLRLPYDRAESQFGRRTSFCGSVNPEQFLNDSTGSRRFLPLQVTACNSLHTIDMQQLWAQAFSYYLDGWQWWCSGELEELLKERHERHTETVPVDELIAETFNIAKINKDFDHRHYTATRILMECGIKEPKSSQANIANAYLKKMGFKQVQCEGVRGYWLEKRL